MPRRSPQLRRSSLPQGSPAARGVMLLAVVVSAALLTPGCARQRYIARRETPRSPLAGPLKLISNSGPRPTERTVQLLRRYDLADLQQKQPGEVLDRLQDRLQTEPSADKLYSYAELAFLHGKKLEEAGKHKDALDQYGASVAHAYLYLFDPGYDLFRNPYDPQFRRACDLYNSSLEAAMRLVNKQKRLRPGEMQIIQTGKRQLQLQVVVRGPWHEENLEKLEFVNDFEIKGGITNHHHSYGLGVPMIAVRGKNDDSNPQEKYYPPGLSFPATAFLRVMPDTPQTAAADVRRCVLELYDPLHSHDIQVANRLVPLETDLSTPLAFTLDNPAFRERDDATIGLLNPAQAQGIKGLYMLEPYDPRRIPVVMVHGLWSSPTTWIEMFNDLRFFPEIRRRYQFWFFQYPTGQPFWISAVQLRDTLAEARQVLDPQRQNLNLDQMVLVGHSMGGLVSKMQTIESGDDFWHILSDKPFDELTISSEERAQLGKVVYFHANPSIKRVVTIGTPHRGSDFANDYTKLAGRNLISLPEMMADLNNKLVRQNPGYFRSTDLLTTKTSIDSLSPDCPIFPILLKAQKSPQTKYHNIVGMLPKDWVLGRLSEEGDGVVSYKSAHLDDVASEITVPADHLGVHRHPQAVLEVRRILHEHLNDLPPQLLAAHQRDVVQVGYEMPLTTRPSKPPTYVEPLRLFGQPVPGLDRIAFPELPLPLLRDD